MAVGDIYRLNVEAIMHGQTVINVLHYRVTVDAANNGANLVAAFQSSVRASWRAAHSNEYAITNYRVQKIAPTPVLISLDVGEGTGQGLVAENACPVYCCAVLTKRTARAGTGYRGRVFLAGVPVTFEDDSTINAAGQAVYTTLANALQATLTSGGSSFVPVLFHRANLTTTDTTKFEIRIIMRSQRRREVGRGI